MISLRTASWQSFSMKVWPIRDAMRIPRIVNGDGSRVRYFQLVVTEWGPEKQRTVARVLYNFGRADGQTEENLRRLLQSIQRAVGSADELTHSVEIDLLHAHAVGAVWTLDASWKEPCLTGWLPQLALGLISQSWSPRAASISSRFDRVPPASADEAGRNPTMFPTSVDLWESTGEAWKELRIGETLRGTLGKNAKAYPYERALHARRAPRHRSQSKRGSWRRWRLREVLLPSSHTHCLKEVNRQALSLGGGKYFLASCLRADGEVSASHRGTLVERARRKSSNGVDGVGPLGVHSVRGCQSWGVEQDRERMIRFGGRDQQCLDSFTTMHVRARPRTHSSSG